MGTNVNLTPELERFAQACVETGRFNNVSEVVRSALRMLQDAEQRKAAFVASLEDAVAEGDRDGFMPSEGVEAEVTAAIGMARSAKPPSGSPRTAPPPQGRCFEPPFKRPT